MVAPTAGSVVLVPFPFSDLPQVKPRPAVVSANAGRGDWIVCQVTSNPYGDPRAVPLVEADFCLLLPLSAILEARRRGCENLR